MIGQVLAGRYRLLEELGRVDERMTFLARDVHTQDPVVIKILLLREDTGPGTLKLFSREAQTLKSLSHPLIPRYLNYFELDSVMGTRGLALVQTYLEARSLETYLLANRKFSEQDVKTIARTLLDILIYLHNLLPPVIHRDIKPGNILLSDRATDCLDQVYLVDFGAVRNFSNRENTSFTLVGTQGYMPPEQFSGRVTPASDLYSLGMTLIALSAGMSVNDLPRRNLRVRFDHRVPFSPEFIDWLKWMTEPDIAKRPGSAEEALDRLLNPRLQKVATEEKSTTEVARKPLDSDISLLKTSAYLEIRLPPIGVNWAIVGVTGFVVLWNLAVLICTVSILFKLPNISLFWVISLPLWWVTGLAMVALVLFSIFGRTRLRLDHQIALIYELFGFKFRIPAPDSVKKVIKIECVAPAENDHEAGVPGIILRTGGKQYAFGNTMLFKVLSSLGLANNPTRFGALTPGEVRWLASELSNWLKLSITFKSNTGLLLPIQRFRQNPPR